MYLFSFKIESNVCGDVNANLYLHSKGFPVHNEEICWENLAKWIYFRRL